MVPENVRKAVDRVLSAQLKPLGYERADIVESEDHDGDPILRIVIHYRKVPGPLDLTNTVGLIGHLRDALEALGETRFPHPRHVFADDQQFKAA